ncbi:DNA-binding HxlR family transcriptional regulator [Microbacterium sp. SORGH_AS 1204]|uniref:winged helix-turn-helix transcriptional regulator n=1 Tax=Microbacterium sp. SORGH_AS_1204 TaxID=3041785 RepID=UPI0027932936|nr:helix-turn-helix domain-containing protein [Microbacterium sp. SORGH_AS_1204]MDQ1135711.1 DNA-binding HxlR family transcriptional regulator [Microbacterium sp. SORGH_AS_1204]
MTTPKPSSAEALHVRDACDRNDVYAAACPCRSMLDLLANKWTALAIGILENGPHRFGELRRQLQGVSPKVLSATLKRMEDAGLVSRAVFAEVPPRVEYALTPLGHGAAVPLAQLRTWVNENVRRPHDDESTPGV